MNIIQEKTFSKEERCPYIETEKITQEYFFATDVSKLEYQILLDKGWRRFGIFYFNYSCKSCTKCMPIRVNLDKFKLSKSQRKIYKKNKETKVIIQALYPTKEIYEIYKKHSINKFNKITSLDGFLETFYYKCNFALQSEYYIDNKLVGIGFLDLLENAISSVYFAYDTDYSNFSLGTFSVLAEIDYAKKIGKKYYNLGYYIKENRSMSYKDKFKINEKLNRILDKWE